MATTSVNWQLAFVPDTAANHVFNNTLLQAGQLGIETDTGLFKVGNGTASWTGLTYATGSQVVAVFFGPSSKAGNLLAGSDTDGGIYLDPQKLATTAAFKQGLDGTLTFDNVAAFQAASPHLGGAAFMGVVMRNVHAAMGADYATLGTTAFAGTSLQQRIKTISDMVTNGQMDLSQILKDSVTAADSTWSSNKINAAIQSGVNAAISNLVGAAPAALDTIYEIADFLQSNQNMIGTITSELGRAVKVTAQSFTTEQQDQARLNIAAASAAFVGGFNELPSATPSFDAIITAALADTTTAPLLPNLYF